MEMVCNIKVGIPMIGGHGWLGGVSYTEVLVKAVSALPAEERPQLILIVQDGNLGDFELYRPFLSHFDGIIYLGNSPEALAGVVPSLQACVRTWEELYEQVDLLFPQLSSVQAGYPAISWIPDFQHVHLPQFFSQDEIRQRDRSFTQVARDAQFVVLSSQDALRDFRELFPNSRATVKVLNFHHLPQAAWYAQDPVKIQQKYGLPDNFLISCNQFWAHKNHRTLFEAIARLEDMGIPMHLVCTGATEDYRNRDYFTELHAYAAELGINDRLHILGSIPREDQIQLIRRATALVQPSLFEGWSTVIEDGRALGKRMFLSDLGVHKEQAPEGACYFARSNAHDLTSRLAEAYHSLSPGPEREREVEALARAQEIVTGYARSFCSIVQEAWWRFHEASMLRTVTSRTQLPDRRAFNILLAEEDPEAFRLSFRAYLEAFSPVDDLALHVLAGERLEEVQASILEVLRELGREPETIPDVSVLDIAATPRYLNVYLPTVNLAIGSAPFLEVARRFSIPVQPHPTAVELREAFERHFSHVQQVDDAALPLISVITPSFNQAEFIEQTIESVLAQGYPSFEHLVMDGGSTDGTVEILERYPHLVWVSEKDRGQSHALNKGLQRAKGEIVAWINSDDWYEPGAFHAVARFFVAHPEANVVMGNCNLTDQAGAIFDLVINHERRLEDMLRFRVGRSIPTQPAIFFRTKLLESCGYVDESLHYTMDYDLWLRFAIENRFCHLNRIVANYRFHLDAKIGDQDWSKIFPECEVVAARYRHLANHHAISTPIERLHEARARMDGGPRSPRVSVVAYVYNYAHYLDAAIQSVLDQTYGDFEFFILDDGSTDGTAEVVQKYLKDPRVRYEVQENKGRDRLHETFNRCLEATSGEFIVIANGDDLMHPEKIQRQLEAFQASPDFEIVFHDAVFIDAAGMEVPGTFDTGIQEEVLAKRSLGRFMFRQNLIPNPTVMFRRSILRRIGLQEVGWLHDYQFWLKAAMARCRFYFLPERLIRYRVHEESLSTSSLRRSHMADEGKSLRREMRERYSIDELFPELMSAPDSPFARAHAHLEMGLLFCGGSVPMLDAALAEFREACELAPDLLEARNNLAVTLHLENHHDEALAILRELAALRVIPEAEFNLQLAQRPFSQVPPAFHLCVPKESPLALGRAHMPETRDPREAIVQATHLVVLEREMTDEALLLLLKTYFASSDPQSVLMLLTDSDAHDARIAALFEAACRQVGLDPARSPEVILQHVKPQELLSVFRGQMLGAQTVLAWPEALRPGLAQASEPSGALPPLVSVIIPTFNRPDLLARAIKSVLAQTFQNFEIVVVNDAGMGAEHVIEQFAAAGRITYIRHARNKGLAAARNTGIKAASGKYIAYLDDDDQYYPDHLATLISSLESSPCRVAYSDAHRIREEVLEGQIVEVERDVPFSFDFSADHFLIRNYVPVLCFLHEKACLDSVGLFDETLTTHEDWDLWVRLSRVYPFVHVKRITCAFSWRSDGSTMSSHRNWDFLRTLDLIYEKYRGWTLERPDIQAEQQVFRANLQASLEREATQKRVSIIIPLYNQVDYTVACLEALAQNTPEALNYEVVLVDNASSDGTTDFLRQLSGDVIVHRNEENLGFAKACNQGARLANGEVLLFLNNDTVPHPGWLEGMLRVLETESKVGAVGSKLLFPDGTLQHAGVVFADDGSPGHWLYQADLATHPLVNQQRDFQCVTAACVAIPRRVFEQVGGFDEGYRNGYEDVELCMQIRKAGYRLVYAPESVVTHVSSVSEGRKDFDDVNLQRFLKRWSGRILPDFRRFNAIAAGHVPTYSVVIITHDAEATIEADLQSVLRALGPDDEVLVFDNASSDRTREITGALAAADSRVKLVESPHNLGFAEGGYHGLRLTSGQFLLLLPQAISTAPGQLERLRMVLTSDVRAAFSTSAMLDDFGLIPRPVLEEAMLSAPPGTRDILAILRRMTDRESPDAGFGRKPRVLALIYALEPCPLIRLVLPLQEAERQGFLEPRFAHLFEDGLTLERLQQEIAWADIVIFQRFSSPQHLALLQYCRSLCKQVVFETDDDLLNLPPTSPHYTAFQRPEIRENIERLASGADLVTVSTPVLASELARLNSNVTVLPNALADALFPEVTDIASLHRDGPVVIGYAATSTHQADLDPIVPALERLIAEFPGQVSLVFMGCTPPELARHSSVTTLPETPDYPAFVAALRQRGIHIGLAPLLDHSFNRSKSAIKWMEYAACGIVSVCSDVGPYRDVVADGVNGLRLKGLDPDDWYQALKALVIDPSYRARLATNAYETVRRDHMLSTNVQRWAHAYRSLLGDLREPTPSEPPSVSIVIPVYNKVAYTQKCLEALIANTPPQIAYEVIIVDNGSSDETSTLLSQLEGEVKVLVNERNLGFAKACNQGAATARGRYVLFLNNDTEPLPGWLEPLIQVLDDDPQVAAVGARLLYPDGTLQHAGVSVVEDLRQGLPLNCLHRYHRLPANHAPANQRADVQVVTGAALMIRGDLFHEVGGFDEGYWNGNEDVDLCFSLGQRGWRIVYEPQSCLVHHESVSGPERWRKVNENIRRLLQRWVGRIVPDELIAVDGSAQPHPARLVSRAAPASSDRVSIVLLGYNQLAYTRLCVESVLEHSDLPFELLLIDNGSVDGTGEYFKGLASRDARVKAILNPRNLGFAVGCNQGIAEATGKYVLFLNNDTIVPRQWLSRLLAHFKERPAVGAVGAVSNCVSGPQQLQTVPVPNRPEAREAILSFGEAIASSMRGKGFELGRLVGFCLMVRRDVLDRIGGFDPRFGIGNFEDDDLCLRVLTAGFRTWVAQDVYVHHFGSRTFAALGPHAFEDTMDQGWDLFKQKWGLASHLDRRQPYLVELPAFDPARHVVPTLETLPAECAEPFRPGISPLSLPDRRQVAFFHHPDWAATSWEEVVLSYARAFAPAEDVSLVLWLDPSQGVGLEEASTRVLDALTRGGLDPESIPDLLLVPDILDLEGLARLYAAVDGVVPGGDPRQAFRADQAGRPVLSALDAPAWHTMARELAEGRRSPQLDANSAELMSEAPLRSERDAPRKESPWR